MAGTTSQDTDEQEIQVDDRGGAGLINCSRETHRE
jgi:hypothetical protein